MCIAAPAPEPAGRPRHEPSLSGELQHCLQRCSAPLRYVDPQSSLDLSEVLGTQKHDTEQRFNQGRRLFERPGHCDTVQETAVGTLAATVERTRRRGSRFRRCVLWVDRGAGLNSDHPQERRAAHAHAIVVKE